ncbi:hypothetical protein KDAU_45640 [Dictyobacter aurantiacus]|uniref:Uncharacterized protein n=1 Tax=Dictyobacter aurantiacus TaxID=1936993 RepID=A0A401ZK48_9CHLR|nr:hypothetical protein KDAU_45640 [Dictyobacter aurantiacus]
MRSIVVIRARLVVSLFFEPSLQEVGEHIQALLWIKRRLIGAEKADAKAHPFELRGCEISCRTQAMSIGIRHILRGVLEKATIFSVWFKQADIFLREFDVGRKADW